MIFPGISNQAVCTAQCCMQPRLTAIK